MRQTEFGFPSVTGVCEIKGCSFMPDDGVYDLVLVIHHGMAEHMERYMPFIRFLCDHETSVYMYDMASHGKSAGKDGEKGWFGEKDGWKGLVEDFRIMIRKAQSENPDKKLIVMGHSMGSFICREYTAMYPEDGYKGAIYMGTGGPNPAAGAGKAMAVAIGAVKGKKHRSTMLNQMAFGSYLKKFEKRTPFDWLTRDEKIVDQYIQDPDCGYLFTVQGMYDLITVNARSNAAQWYRSVPKELPVLLISGGMDPVGAYGIGVKKVGDRLRETGHTKVTVKIYPECRHEVLNELNREQVMQDIAEWMKRI